MKFYFILVIFLSSFILIPCTPQEQKKIKKSLPRKQLTRLRQSISLSVNPEELFSSTSTSTLIAGVSSNNKNVKFPSLLSNELLSSFTSTTIRSSLNNAYLLGKKKYYSYFKRIALDLSISLVTKYFFSLMKNPVCGYVRIVFFTVANGYCCFGKTQLDALVHLIKQIIKFFGYVYISLFLSKMIEKKRIIFKAFCYAIVTLVFDYYISFVLCKFGLD